MGLVRALGGTIALIAGVGAARAAAPLYDVVALNIGLNCQWQKRCMDQQHHAMKRALKFVKKKQPPMWRVETCNKNAARNRYRVDWIGFDNCVRNASLVPLPARATPRRAKPAGDPPARSARPGERGH
jgi:hypothetical protein